MSYGDINNIPLTVIPRARAHVRKDGAPRSEAALAAWRTKTFGGDFDPVREAVEDAVNAFSYRQPEDDRRIWLKVANEIGYEAFRELYLEQLSIMRECKLRIHPPPSRTASTVTQTTIPIAQFHSHQGRRNAAPFACAQQRNRGTLPVHCKKTAQVKACTKPTTTPRT